MKNYSIVRIGNEYVVQAGENSILKVSSRRKAAKLVTDAAGLAAAGAGVAAVDRAPSISVISSRKFLDDRARFP